MNRKGQALVEFVLILPIFLMILFTIVDFGILLSSKNDLENVSTDIALMIRNGDSIEVVSSQYSNLEIQMENYQEKYQKITVSKKLSLITPILERVLGNPCEITVERVIPNA